MELICKNYSNNLHALGWHQKLKLSILGCVCYTMVTEVCPVCFKFLQSIYDKKKVKEVRLAPDQPCKSMYHKKLVDR